MKPSEFAKKLQICFCRDCRRFVVVLSSASLAVEVERQWSVKYLEAVVVVKRCSRKNKATGENGDGGARVTEPRTQEQGKYLRNRFMRYRSHGSGK
jgi:hypothetical protein